MGIDCVKKNYSMCKTQVVKIDAECPDRKIIARAAEIIKKGGLVVFPTETVYGIAADSTNKKAITRLNSIKKRPDNKPYAIQIAYKKDLPRYLKLIPKEAKLSIKKYWPGPLTGIFPARKGGTIGVRIPDNKVALALLRRVGRPLAAPSANVSGGKSPVNARQAGRQLNGLVDLILDAGPTRYRKDSTIIDFTSKPVKVIRKGVLFG